MNPIMIISKTNMAKNQDYYLQILTAWCMKLKLKIVMTILVRVKKCLRQNMTMIQTH